MDICLFVKANTHPVLHCCPQSVWHGVQLMVVPYKSKLTSSLCLPGALCMGFNGIGSHSIGMIGSLSCCDWEMLETAQSVFGKCALSTQPQTAVNTWLGAKVQIHCCCICVMGLGRVFLDGGIPPPGTQYFDSTSHCCLNTLNSSCSCTVS